jgi:hypothetical protein
MNTATPTDWKPTVVTFAIATGLCDSKVMRSPHQLRF